MGPSLVFNDKSKPKEMSNRIVLSDSKTSLSLFWATNLSYMERLVHHDFKWSSSSIMALPNLCNQLLLGEFVSGMRNHTAQIIDFRTPCLNQYDRRSSENAVVDTLVGIIRQITKCQEQLWNQRQDSIGKDYLF